jgi:hypothetical protein
MRSRYFVKGVGKGYRGDTEGHRLNALGRGGGVGSRGGRPRGTLSNQLQMRRAVQPSLSQSPEGVRPQYAQMPQASPSATPSKSVYEEQNVVASATLQPPPPPRITTEVLTSAQKLPGQAIGERQVVTPGVPPRLSQGLFGGYQ